MVLLQGFPVKARRMNVVLVFVKGGPNNFSVVSFTLCKYEVVC